MARKAKPTGGPASPAVQEYIKKQQEEAAANKAKAAPGAAPPGGPVPFDPMAAARAPLPRKETLGPKSRAGAEGFFSGKTILVGAMILLIGGGAFGAFWWFGKSGSATPKLGSTEISQLQQGMTSEQAQAILGKPQMVHQGPGSTREGRVDRIDNAGMFEYYRKGTLMLVYDKSSKMLIEVCIGETPDEYYKRKSGEEKALWESYPDEGFIHQDVWRPNQSL